MPERSEADTAIAAIDTIDAIDERLATAPENRWERLRECLGGFDLPEDRYYPVDALCALLDDWPDGEHQAALEYAQEHLAAWPQESWPHAPLEYERKLLDSTKLALSRSLRADYDKLGDTRTQKADVFGHIEALVVDLAGCSLDRDQSGWEEGDYPLAWLSGMTGLKTLTLTGGLGLGWGTWLSGHVDLPKLEELDASFVNVDALFCLKGFPALRCLKLDGITLETLRGIEAAHKLERLEIACAGSFTDVEPLEDLPALRHLSIAFSQRNRKCAEALTALTQLASLTIRGLPPEHDLSELQARFGSKLLTL